MKTIITLLILVVSILQNVQAMDLAIKRITSDDMIWVMNHVNILGEYRSTEPHIRLLTVEDESGSAGFETCEITHTILVALSESGEYPKQSLFDLGSFFDPELVSFTEDSISITIEISYGIVDERNLLIVGVKSIDGIYIVSHK